MTQISQDAQGRREAVFAKVYREMQKGPGVVLFTALQWQPSSQSLKRLFTSHPEAYPSGGAKNGSTTDGADGGEPSSDVSALWLDTVIKRKQIFYAADDESTAAVFSDMDLIRSLGCGSVINLPVLSGGQVVGVLAVLAPEGTYTPASVTDAEAIVAAHATDLAAAFAPGVAAAVEHGTAADH